MKDYLVRLTKSELKNFKNVNYGEMKYINFTETEQRAQITNKDINGIYGQNGSGKTAIVEALDILQHIMSGNSVNYEEYEGMFNKENIMELNTEFYVETSNEKYKVRYELILEKIVSEKKINIHSENIQHWRRGATWKTKKNLKFINPFYNMDNVIGDEVAKIESDDEKYVSCLKVLKSVQNLAVFCAQKNVSLFFNDIMFKSLEEKEVVGEEQIFSDIIKSLIDFARMRFQVVKVNQLGANYSNSFIPMNIHSETENEILKGCIPLFMKGSHEFPEELYDKLINIVSAINIALKAIIPNLFIELEKKNEEINKDGMKTVQVEVYSNRDGKRFLTKFESEGIKRIISLLNYLISLYNDPSICLVVDELDAGIFEYLLGELVGVIAEEAKGQLIFTSHNLRVLEKLDKKNIICSTTNPDNRYISLNGIEKNHNKRDFYIRTIVLGGQKEKLYDDADLQDMSYALNKAWNLNNENNVKLNFSEDFLKALQNANEEND
ncbi:MAG: AAA family ATPase [Lachnospiraceae bacterium]